MPARVAAGVVIVGDCERSPATRHAGRLPTRLGEAEVEHLHRAVGADLDVGRLQVAVDDPLLVRRLERFGDLPRDRQRFIDRHGPVRDAIGQRRRPRPAPARAR